MPHAADFAASRQVNAAKQKAPQLSGGIEKALASAILGMRSPIRSGSV
jgi:hypothetical protein